MISEEAKKVWKTIGNVTLIGAAILVVATIAYHLGAFKSVATAYFWYDIKRLLYFIYDSVIVPCCLFYAGIGIIRLFLSLFPDKEEQVPDSVKELQGQCSRINGWITNLKGTQHNVIIRVQDLEAKMLVICSILSLNKNEELQQSATDVLKDC